MFQKNSTSTETKYTDQTIGQAAPTLSAPLSRQNSASIKPVESDAITGPPAQRFSSSRSHASEAAMERLCAFLSSRVSEGVTLKELSCFLGYSEKYTSDFFQRYMGHPFSEHLRQLRLDKATSMLLEERHTIAKIAECVGFSDAFAFSHFFKRSLGCSPTEYRRQQLRQADIA